MRIAIATLIGGLVMFFWGAFAHMVLPLGELSMRAPTNEDSVLAALREGLPAEHGIYVLPHFDPTGGPHRHMVNVEPGSTLEDIFGAPEHRVNSTHHQAVNQLGRRLRVGARSPDGAR